MTDEHVYPFISDDESPRPEYYQPAECLKYCLVTDDDEVLGLWIFRYVRAALWDVHTCLLKKARGKKAYEAVKMATEWAWKHLPGSKRLITEVPVYNRPALIFALKAGMEKYGVNPKSYLKNGVLHDVILLGISRGEN